MTAAWYVIRTTPQGELRAYKWLKIFFHVHGMADAIEDIFLPIERKSVAHGRGRKRAVEVPIVRGYLFPKLVKEQINPAKVEEAPGIMHFLTQDGVSLATVTEEEISLMKEAERIINEPKPQRTQTRSKKRNYKLKEGLEIIQRRLDTMGRYPLEDEPPESETVVFPLCSVA